MDKNNEILQQSIDDRIDAFIRGMMTEEEEATFKQEIQSNPELSAQVLATVSLIKGIRTQNANQEKLLINKRSGDKMRKVIKWACSISAVIAILFSYQEDKRYREVSAVLSPYYSEFSLSDADMYYSRGDVDSLSIVHLQELFKTVQTQRNMSLVIKELQSIYSSNDNNPYHFDGDYNYSVFAFDIGMNLAFAYIKDNQYTKARNILETLVMDYPDNPQIKVINKLLWYLEGYPISNK